MLQRGEMGILYHVWCIYFFRFLVVNMIVKVFVNFDTELECSLVFTFFFRVLLLAKCIWCFLFTEIIWRSYWFNWAGQKTKRKKMTCSIHSSLCQFDVKTERETVIIDAEALMKNSCQTLLLRNNVVLSQKKKEKRKKKHGYYPQLHAIQRIILFLFFLHHSCLRYRAFSSLELPKCRSSGTFLSTLLTDHTSSWH